MRNPLISQAFWLIAQAILPPAKVLGRQHRTHMLGSITDFLNSRSPAQQMQIRLFAVLLALILLPFPKKRTEILHKLETSPILLIRRGVWGIRTLIFYGYYGRSGIREEIGYDPHLRGWNMHAAPPTGKHD